MITAVLAGVLIDLCAPLPAPAADATIDADAAQAYAQVGDDARAAGDARVAATAYRKALAADPSNAAARAALDALCATDRAAAVAAPAAPPPDDDALLDDAIARYRAGDHDAAAALFAPLADRAGTAAAGAHFFLGLIELARHDGGQAARDFDLAARDPAYAELAVSMRRLAHRDGRLSVLLVAQPELDTNVQLLPDTPPLGSTSGVPMTDEDILFLGTFTARPVRGLVLRDTMTFRDQRTIDALDFWGNDAQVAGEVEDGPDHATFGYDLDYELLAGAPYLTAHRGTVTFRHDLDRVSLVAGYALRRRDYRQEAQAPFTGWVHRGELGAIVHLGDRVDLDVRALGRREVTQDPVFADAAAGGQLGVRARPASRVRLSAFATGWWARYDQPEPDGLLRRDVQLELGIDAEVDLSDRVIAVAGIDGIRNTSTVEDFQYTKLVARAGLAIAFGGP